MPFPTEHVDIYVELLHNIQSPVKGDRLSPVSKTAIAPTTPNHLIDTRNKQYIASGIGFCVKIDLLIQFLHKSASIIPSTSSSGFSMMETLSESKDAKKALQYGSISLPKQLRAIAASHFLA